MKRSWLLLGIPVALAVAGYSRARQYPLPNPPAQNQRAKCATFFSTRPTLSRTTTFLKGQGIDYDQVSKADLLVGYTATDFQKQHRKEIGSKVIFRIYDIKKPICGHLDALFIVSFGQRGQLLKAENMDAESGCLDF